MIELYNPFIKEEVYMNAPAILEYKGVKIYKKNDSCYHFTLDNTIFTQRAGITEYKAVIDSFFKGKGRVSHGQDIFDKVLGKPVLKDSVNKLLQGDFLLENEKEQLKDLALKINEIVGR